MKKCKNAKVNEGGGVLVFLYWPQVYVAQTSNPSIPCLTLYQLSLALQFQKESTIPE